MTTHRSTLSPHRRPTRIGRRIAAVSGSTVVALSALLTLSSSPATAAPAAGPQPPTDSVPAAGAVITCDGVGALTATSGYLRQREPVTIDGRGRAHVLFTIGTDQVRLVGPDGSRYQLIGAGYDRVLYPTTAITGAVVNEDARYIFDVLGPRGIAGRVRFAMHIGADQIPHISDSSTCQLPNL